MAMEKCEIISFLMIGQSNMAGRGILGEVEPIENDNCFMLRMGLWEKMCEPINPDGTNSLFPLEGGVTLAASFAEEMAKHTGKKIGLIPCAVGGTEISQWMPGEILYDHAVSLPKLAMRTSTLGGIIWHQGENDAASDEKVMKYKENFLTMIKSLKKDLELGDIPIVLGELSTKISEEWQVGDRGKKMNSIFHELESVIPKCKVASSQGLTLKDDGIHFDSKSCRIFGKRYFEKMKKFFKRGVSICTS